MRHSVVVKLVAILLAAAALTAAIACAGAVLALGSAGLLGGSTEEMLRNRLEQGGYYVADSLISEYACREYSNCPQELLDAYRGDTEYMDLNWVTIYWEKWSYMIRENGVNVDARGEIPEGADTLEYTMRVWYPVVTAVVPSSDYAEGEVYLDQQIMAAQGARYPGEGELPISSEIPDSYMYAWEFRSEDGDAYTYFADVRESPQYTVTLYPQEGAYTLRSDGGWQLVFQLQPYWLWLILGGAACLLAFAGLMVYLCCAAGRKPGEERVQAMGLNALPLDLYAAVDGCGIFFAVTGMVWMLQAMHLDVDTGYLASALFAGLFLFAACLLLVGFVFALAAQIKMGGGHWWRYSILGRLVRLCGRFLRWAGRCAARLYGLLPLSWQWLLAGLAALLSLMMGVYGYNPWFFPAALLDFLLLLYGVYAFGKLRRGAKAMSQGNLEVKVSTKHLTGCFRDFAGDLNALGEAAMVAAQRQMKSERMKAELITNVSHDIKTPLTSIINYVDLLQKAQTEEEKAQYLEVLARQSQSMKKLIEDLVEMSKASTGNIQADIRPVDAVEAVNQAVGEFSDKLRAAHLTPVIRAPEEPARMLADGRLLWRVLSNLLNNAVKYAMPDTRLYIDVVRLELAVTISLKNVSKEALNVDAEELMERFVRGDASRNTEGSGLGLNIAKSLMELQHGQLQLLVDGDLFKATLYFPVAPEEPAE